MQGAVLLEGLGWRGEHWSEACVFGLQEPEAGRGVQLVGAEACAGTCRRARRQQRLWRSSPSPCCSGLGRLRPRRDSRERCPAHWEGDRRLGRAGRCAQAAARAALCRWAGVRARHSLWAGCCGPGSCAQSRTACICAAPDTRANQLSGPFKGPQQRTQHASQFLQCCAGCHCLCERKRRQSRAGACTRAPSAADCAGRHKLRADARRA